VIQITAVQHVLNTLLTQLEQQSSQGKYSPQISQINLFVLITNFSHQLIWAHHEFHTSLQFFNQLFSHELYELIEKELVQDNLDPNTPEIMDICAVSAS
jgi:hypothetical protein